VASVTYDADGRWLRGFTQETNASATVNLLTINNDIPVDGVLFDGTTGVRFYDVLPFIVEVVSEQTAFDLRSANPLDGFIEEQIKAATQKAAERELWDGVAARANTPVGTGYLTQTGGATILTSGGVTSARALALLEQSISNSPTGARGVIHVTRDVASDLGSKLLYKADSQVDDTAYAVTRLGTLVVIGSGYSGKGPIGTAGAAATATNKWMFATGSVDVVLGESDIVNESISQGFNPSVNDSVVKVQRPAAVSFDPSIRYTAQVTLS
jgi:hypothetical protein